jgi:hypothetical protein
VRSLGVALGLDEESVWRHPFPVSAPQLSYPSRLSDLTVSLLTYSTSTHYLKRCIPRRSGFV